MDGAATTVLLVGSGAREHAIAVALARSPRMPALVCFGSANNPGIQKLCKAYAVGKITDPKVCAPKLRAIAFCFAFRRIPASYTHAATVNKLTSADILIDMSPGRRS
eukprot:6190799-Pleurochrysis_carterae.AAC.1